MDEWIKRLSALVKYWKARLMSDIQIRIKVNEDNDQANDNYSSRDGFRGHWNGFQSYVNTTIWNWCILNGCRGITVRYDFTL